MKKLASFLLALLLCMSVLAGLCYAADPEPDPDSTPVVTVDPKEPDSVNAIPDGQDSDIKE